jgi:hypothetical protein
MDRGIKLRGENLADFLCVAHFPAFLPEMDTKAKKRTVKFVYKKRR